MKFSDGLTIFDQFWKFFVVVLLRSWIGRIEAMLIMSIIFFFIVIYFLIKDRYLPKKIYFSKKYAKDSLSFGLPLVPHQISYWIKTGLDRYLIAFLLTQEAVGIYSAGYQVGFSIFILVSAVNQAIVPYLYKKLKYYSFKIKVITFFSFLIMWLNFDPLHYILKDLLYLRLYYSQLLCKEFLGHTLLKLSAIGTPDCRYNLERSQ